jgi:ElaB/YqjD/DUF883 family membrane-anchored ribosome-binding protein
MEVYFKNLTAEGVPVEKLVEDLVVLANDVEGLVKATAAGLPEHSKEQIMTALQRFKAQCEHFRVHALAGVQATDRFIRRYPYYALGGVFGTGFLLGALLRRK